MSFTEFLLANGDVNLVNYLDHVDKIEAIPDAFANPLYEKLRICFSLRNLTLDGALLNIPLYMADYADKLIGISLKDAGF